LIPEMGLVPPFFVGGKMNDELNWPEIADAFNPTPYYAIKRNRQTGRNNDLCPMCLAPKNECWKVEGPEDDPI
jgi:hypothetical protein